MFYLTYLKKQKYSTVLYFLNKIHTNQHKAKAEKNIFNVMIIIVGKLIYIAYIILKIVIGCIIQLKINTKLMQTIKLDFSQYASHLSYRT